MAYLLIAVLVVGLSASQTLAQNTLSGNNRQIIGPRKQLVMIIFSGLAGAALGLSTLSFYDRPQDRLSNISIGFAGGIIAGTAYTTYQTVTKSQHYYKTMLPQLEQEQMLVSQKTVLSKQDLSPLRLSWEWSF